MLQTAFIRENRELVLEGLRKRNWADEALNVVDEVLVLDDQRKNLQTQLDNALAERNRLSKSIGDLMKAGQATEAQTQRETVATLKEQAAAMEADLEDTKERLNQLLYRIPNIPYQLVPAGKSADDNLVYKAWDKPFPTLYEGAQPHWELAKQYQLFDLELGVKITGAGFPLYRNQGARLQRALINFFLDEATAAGYEEMNPPLMVNGDSAFGTGQLPDKEGQMYYVTEDELYLIPTAEVPLTNVLRDVILDEADFPVKMTGYTPCFRREAGSYGAHVRGLNRVHQFDKVEIVHVERPDRSYDALHQMLEHVEGLLNKLELPYRILRLCGGDMGFASAMTYDFEVYSAAQERWLEVSSVSNFETFQSNRLKLRYRTEKGIELAHTLNGSALALPRIVAALLENNQTPNGIELPAVLHGYTGFAKIG